MASSSIIGNESITFNVIDSLGKPVIGIVNYYYTTNNTEPSTTNGTLWVGNSITITTSCILKVKAYCTNYKPSSEVSKTITFALATPSIIGTNNISFDVLNTFGSIVNGTVNYYYTTNGTSPNDTNGTLWNGNPIPNTTSITIKIKAYRNGYNTSPEAVKVITAPSIPTTSIIPNTYTTTQSIKLSSSIGCEIRYTLDGTNPSESSTLYESQLNISTNTTIKAIAIKLGLISPIATFSYIIKPILSKPIVNIPANTYPTSQSILLSCDDSNAFIYYTTNETTPSELSTLYTGEPISISKTTTLKAIAIKNGMTNSAIMTATYVINNLGVVIYVNTIKKFILNWDSQSSVKNYNVFINNNQINTIQSTNELSCILGKLTPSCAVKIKLIGKDDSNISTFSNNIIVLGLPNSIKHLKVSNILNNSVTLNWKSFGNITKYIKNVKFYISDGTNTTIISKTYDEVKNKQIIISNLNPNTLYSITASVSNIQRESEMSNKVNFKTL